MESARHPNIEIITNATVESVSGPAGDFSVRVVKRPRYVDEEKCTACGICASYCPAAVPDPYDENLAAKKAVSIAYAQAAPSAYSVDPGHCLFLTKEECKQCSKVCETGAIDFGQKEEVAEFRVGAVILSPGFSSFDPARDRSLRYKEAPNVVTGREFERICCASGPTLGKIARPSDGEKPHRIAILQCIGSRDRSLGNPYCSSVCCKYAVKDAIVALEHEPDLDITIFFMDLRMYGKGFETFYLRAVKEGVKFVRSRVSEITGDPDTNDVALRYVTEEGELREDTFNLVVLAHGLEPPAGASLLARAAGTGSNGYGFCRTGLFTPLETTREGVFAAGGFRAPASIPESVVQAGGAAASCAALLKDARGSMVVEKTYPEERVGPEEPPRIGVFVCHCGKNIGGVVDVAEVKRYAQELPDVVMVEENLYSCSQDTQALIRESIEKHGLSRVVVAACTPRTHEPLFQDTLREAGLNECLIEMVNIRDQCSWVHMMEKKAATDKAKDLVRMAAAKARLIAPVPETVLSVTPRGLVIGGGVTGMNAALNLAEQGFECFLVEREAELGGSLKHTRYTLRGADPQEYLDELRKKVEGHRLIRVFTGASIEEMGGFVGNFHAAVKTGEGEGERIESGVVIVATGAEPFEPDGYLYGEDERVMLQETLEERLAAGGLGTPGHVVMIQCVGSRDETNPYCSSVCCGEALKNALKIKELSPGTRVTILYRDVMTYGFDEAHYDRARDEGVVFLRYRRDEKPVVEKVESGLIVRVKSPLLKREVSIPAEMVALSTAKVPRENRALNKALKLPVSEDGFFLEAHAQLKPVDSYVDGIYLAGKAQFPKPVDECIAGAGAAASRAAILLARGYVRAEPIISSTDEEECIGCGICQPLCPYSAIQMVKEGKKKKARVISAACKGCGVCASYCPTRCVNMDRFTDEQIAAQIAAFGGGE